MNYIVFDLEWNQCPYGKNRENPQLPFEIIEIGAIKLDDQKRTVDEFHMMIHPMVYKKMHYRTQEILGVDMKTLESGEFFYRAIRQFLQWCGEEYRFCTWGNMDLVELQRNMKYYGLQDLLKGPIRFYDVQKLFSLAYEDGKSRKALEYGIDYLKLEKSGQFHHALTDAYYTAEIFKTLDDGIADQHFSIDCYQNPKSKKEEIHVTFETYEKYISREFDCKEDAMKDREVASSRCFLCGRSMRKKIRWFSINSKNYYCAAYCSQHGFFKGKVRMKKTEEGKFYVIKTMKRINEEEVDDIRQKKESVKSRKKQKKREEKENRQPIR